MTRKTVLMLVTNAYDPDPRIRQEALSLIGMGCQVRLIAWDRDRKAAARECVDGVDVERIFVSSTHGRGATQIVFYIWVYVLMLTRALRTPFDVIHCHDLDTLPIGFLVGRLKQKPVVYDAHESFSDMLAGSVPMAIRRGLLALENFLVRRVDLLITVGEKLRRHFAERGARRSVVVGNWKRLADFTRSRDEVSEVRRKLGVADGSLLVVCITQLLEDRKIDELLEAARACPDVSVLVAGKGIVAPRVHQAAALNPRIIFPGFVTGKQIADFTCAADVIYYGFDPANPNARFSAPNKLYEALAAGRPLITGDFGEIADVVRESRCGVVLSAYTPAELRRAFGILKDPGLRAEMSRHAADLGRTSLNWQIGEEVLYREYSALLPGLHKPAQDLELPRLQAVRQ